MNTFKPRIVWPMLVGALLILLLNLQPVVRWMEELELRSLDMRQATLQENRSASKISLVELDNSITARELFTLFGRYPFRLDVYGYLNRFLARGGAKVAMYDINFTSAPDECHPESDRQFIDSFGQPKRIISALSTYGRDDQTRNDYNDRDKMAFLMSLKREWLTKPIPHTLAVSLFTDIRPPIVEMLNSPMEFYPASGLKYDIRGKARRAILFSGYWGKLFLPNLAPALLMEGYQDLSTPAPGIIRFGKYSVNLKGEAAPIIRWYGNVQINDLKRLKKEKPVPDVYPRFPFWHVVKSQLWWECQQNPNQSFCSRLDFSHFKPIDPLKFKDQRVLIGMTSLFYDADTHPSPYMDRYPGVYIQANVLDNLMHNDFVGRPGWRVSAPWLASLFGEENPGVFSVSLLTLLTVLLMGGVTAYSCLRWSSVSLSAVFVTVLGVVYSLFCQWAYQYLNLWVNWVYPVTAMLLTFTGAYVFRYLTTEKRKNLLRFAFQKYVSPAVMRNIEKNPDSVSLGGERREMTMLFCDIRGFTTYSENNPPEVVQTVLTRYFSVMNGIILNQYGGSINKLIGDAIMAYWGFPLDNEDHAFQAVSAALAMREAIQVWQADPNNPPIQIGIGINTGDAVVGNVGSQDFMDFTVIGDAVNVASRLEGINKELGTTIIISASTYEKVRDRIEAVSMGLVHVKGKADALEVYEPVGLRSDLI